ncbi:MAG: DUF2857 domain-containing protein [Proteobacteria bacterium]|nr:DUF2857 domain-containing protein [Pseudomonadota bacterium]
MNRAQSLNLAVIAQMLDDLRQGQSFKAIRMGLEKADLDTLRDASNVCFLAFSAVPWCSVNINLAVFRGLLKKIEQDQKEAEETERLLRLSASTKLLAQNYGLTSQEIAMWRGIVGVPAIRGRPHNLAEDACDDLWKQLLSLIEESGTDIDDERAMIAIVANLAESTQHPFTSIWRLVLEWKNDGLLTRD